MAELNKRLQLQNNSGTVEPAKLYTTIAELIPNKQYLPLEVDGVGNAYAQLDEVGAVNPTRGRFYRNADGKTYQICSQAAVPYGEQAYTTPGTYTFTVPANVTKVRVAMCGGGSIGGGGGRSSNFGSYLAANTSTNAKHFMTTDHELTADEMLSYRKSYSAGYKLGFEEIRETNGYGYGHGGYHRSGGGGSSMQTYFHSFNYPSEFKSSYIDVIPNETISCTVAIALGWVGNEETGGGFILIGWGGEIR